MKTKKKRSSTVINRKISGKKTVGKRTKKVVKKATKKPVQKLTKNPKKSSRKKAVSSADKKATSSAGKKNKFKVYFRRKTDFYVRSGETRLLQGNIEETSDEKTPFRRKVDLTRCDDLADSELVKIVMEQNPDAYRVLFRRYEKSLFIYMFHLVRNKEEVEDLLQNVFAKTYKNLFRFDQERKFSSWIYRIAHNEAVNFIKRKSKRKLVSWEDVSTSKDKLETSVDAEDAAEIFMHKEISEEVDEALDVLPAKYKKILLLRYFNEYSYQKIGEILDKPVNTVGTLINRAKKKLVEVIEEKKAA